MKNKGKEIVQHFQLMGVFAHLEAYLISQMPGGADRYRKESAQLPWWRGTALGCALMTLVALFGLTDPGSNSGAVPFGLVALIGAAVTVVAAGVATTGFRSYKSIQDKIRAGKATLRDMRRLRLFASDESQWPQRRPNLADPMQSFGKFLEFVGNSAAHEVSSIERSRPNELERRRKLKALLAEIVSLGTLVEDVLLRDLAPAFQNAEWRSPFVWPGKTRRVRPSGAIAARI